MEAEISGVVSKIEKEIGEKVVEGDILLFCEAMKMEIPLIASRDGIIKEIKVKEGEVVEEGQTLVILSI